MFTWLVPRFVFFGGVITGLAQTSNNLFPLKAASALSYNDEGKQWETSGLWVTVTMNCGVCLRVSVPASSITQSSVYILFFPWDAGSGQGLRYRRFTETHTNQFPRLILLLFSYLWLQRYRIWKRKQGRLPCANKNALRRYQEASEIHTHTQKGINTYVGH